MSGNRWFEHCRAYAKEHNISNACALSLKACRDAYKSNDDMKNDNLKISSNNFARELKSMQDNDKPLLRMKFNRFPAKTRENIEKNNILT